VNSVFSRVVPQRLIAPLLLVGAVALVPWTVALSFRLPADHTSHHWDAAWIGFDLALVAALVATGYGLVRRARWLQTAAVVAATLLLTDAWFDNLLAAGRTEHLEAGLEAAIGEVPLAVLCVWLAGNTERAISALDAARAGRA
jgi:hypothetical protein